MSYKKYTGKDKYHFRWYRKTRNHPFLVVLVVGESDKNGVIKISGFNITSSSLAFIKNKNDYIKLDNNPSSENDKDAYLCKRLVQNVPSKYFSRPIRGWRLSESDIEKVDALLKK